MFVKLEKKLKRNLVNAAIGLAFLSISSPAWAQAGKCYSDAEMQTFHARALQTELMLSALNCQGATESTFRDKYGNWVRKFTSDLAVNGEALKKIFNTRFGGNGPSQLNQFTTKLANVISGRAHQDPQFCVAALAALDSSMDPKIRTIAEGPRGKDYAADMGIVPCPPPKK